MTPHPVPIRSAMALPLSLTLLACPSVPAPVNDLPPAEAFGDLGPSPSAAEISIRVDTLSYWLEETSASRSAAVRLIDAVSMVRLGGQAAILRVRRYNAGSSPERLDSILVAFPSLRAISHTSVGPWGTVNLTFDESRVFGTEVGPGGSDTVDVAVTARPHHGGMLDLLYGFRGVDAPAFSWTGPMYAPGYGLRDATVRVVDASPSTATVEISYDSTVVSISRFERVTGRLIETKSLQEFGTLVFSRVP